MHRLLIRHRLVATALVALSSPCWVHAQQATRLDAEVDAIRAQSSFSPAEEQVIGQWVAEKVSTLGDRPDPDAYRAFVTRLDAERLNVSNSAAFLRALAAAISSVAETRLSRESTNSTVARGLTKAMYDLDRIEAAPGLIAGLSSPSQGARYLSAKGLGRLADRIEADKGVKVQVIAAVHAAGVREANPYVLRQMYAALVFPSLAPESLNAILAMVDRRIERRREGVRAVDGAEVPVTRYLRDPSPAIRGALKNEQKAEIVQRLAFLLRSYAQRYRDSGVPDEERETIELLLDGIEDILAAFVPSGGGNIRGRMSTDLDPAGIWAETVRWVGDPESQTAGVLNGQPWNVPIGAP